ncbi:ROK family protein [Arthrobacter sp. MDT3-44]
MPLPVPATPGAILELVRSGQVRTRRQLQDITGLSRSTLSLRTSVLTAAGYLKETGQVAGSTGRPAKILSFDEERQLVVAVDLGVSRVNIALLDGGGQILVQAANDSTLTTDPDDTVRYLTRRINELVARSGRDRTHIAGVGVGIPGPVRFDTQRPNTPPLMPGWHDFPFSERLNEALDLPVFADNDANLMALGEARARYSDLPSLLFVKVGTGIGAGIILHGEPERGQAGGAGDIGHIRIVREGRGAPCSCGATGCLATEASGGALARKLSETGAPVESTQDVARLLQSGDTRATDLAEDAGHLLGEVLATSVALLNPAVLVLGGIIPATSPQFVAAVKESIFGRTVPLATRELSIVTSSLGSDAGLQGARHLVIGQTFSPAAVDARLASVT